MNERMLFQNIGYLRKELGFLWCGTNTGHSEEETEVFKLAMCVHQLQTFRKNRNSVLKR